VRDHLVRLSVLAAAAVALNVGERMLLGGVPFVRVGLANAVTVVVLIAYGPVQALAVTGLRLVAAAVLTGTLLGPTFAMALAGGLGAWVLMSSVWVVGRWLVGPLGLSVLGALGHNVCQVAAASLVVLGTWELASLWPLIALVSVGAGCVTGLAALAVGRALFPDGGDAGREIDNRPSTIGNGDGGRELVE
jgi:heptaprenyl diphosphate synthase